MKAERASGFGTKDPSSMGLEERVSGVRAELFLMVQQDPVSSCSCMTLFSFPQKQNRLDNNNTQEGVFSRPLINTKSIYLFSLNKKDFVSWLGF